MDLRRKIKRTNPDLVVLYWPDDTSHEPTVLDRKVVSNTELNRMIDARDWVTCEAREAKGGTVMWRVHEEDLDTEEIAPTAVLDDLERAMSTPPPAGQDQTYPERFLRLMILAQQSNSEGYQRQIEVLLNTFVSAQERFQDLLEQQHEMILAQREQIRELGEKDNEKDDEEKGDRTTQLVEALAPVVLPLLMQAQQQQQAPSPAPAPQKAAK